MLSWTSASGMKLTPAFTSGNLTKLGDPFTRSIGFTYTSQGLSGITDPTGQTITPGYDSATGNLTSLTWQDALTKTTFVYDSPNANQSWALTGVIDENGKRYATFGYDAAGHAISTEHAGGVDKYSVTYANNGVGPKVLISEVYDTSGSTPLVRRYHDWALDQPPVVTWPNGAVETFKAPDLTLNYPRDTGRQQPAGAGCGAASNAITYDSNGNKASEDDFNGHRTCYANDLSRNLESTRIEGLLGGSSGNSCTTALAATSFTGLPAEARKISTKWHPDWAIKVQQAEPQLLTTWVYNGQPDPTNSDQTASCAPSTALLPDDGSGTSKPIAVLCKKVEQATTDATGLQGLSPTLDNSDATITSQRQWSYTYNQYGQVLTSTGPQGMITNAYYADTSSTGTAPNAVGHYMGDLYTVTNQAGHVTTYNSYDKAGRVLNMSDPNGLVTAYTYWPRGWIKASKQCSSGSACDASTSGGGLRTTYDYWPTGLLKLVTQPDGGTLSYAYDDAHRLTDVTDNLGNTVHYTLDNAGNRKAEDFKDLSGNLTRNISRTFDALNRLQLVTGAAQ
jgi:YD repeat-containing protein